MFKPNVKKMKAKGDVDGLINALKYKKDYNIQNKAAKALGDIGDAKAVEPLIQALNDEEYHVRASVAEVLGDMGDARAVEPLIAALKDEEYEVRGRAAEALGKIGDARAVEPFIQIALKDKNYQNRIDAIRALGEIADARAVEPLIQALKESYLFCWDNIPGKDNERLINYLRDELYLDWAKYGVHIIKIFDGRTIVASSATLPSNIRTLPSNHHFFEFPPNQRLFKLGYFVCSLRLNDEKTKITIPHHNCKAIFIKPENGKLNIYKGLGYPLGVISGRKYENKEILYALGKMGDARAVGPLMQVFFGEPEYESHARKLVKDAIKKIIEDLKKTVEEHGEAAVEPIFQNLNSEYWGVRCWTAELLGNIGGRLPIHYPQ